MLVEQYVQRRPKRLNQPLNSHLSVHTHTDKLTPTTAVSQLRKRYSHEHHSIFLTWQLWFLTLFFTFNEKSYNRHLHLLRFDLTVRTWKVWMLFEEIFWWNVVALWYVSGIEVILWLWKHNNHIIRLDNKKRNDILYMFCHWFVNIVLFTYR